jgi:hypothetical protein
VLSCSAILWNLVRKFALLASFCLALAGCSGKPQPVYQDPRANVDRRTEDLLRRMSANEKLDLLRTGHANTRLGIPALDVQTSAPASGLALAATWNPAIASQVAAHSNSGFGAYGEDPWLASRMSVAWTSGAQSEGRIPAMMGMPCPDIDPRVSNEILFPAFRAAIEEAGLWAIQSACAEQPELGDWGFRGFLVGNRNDDEDSVRRVLRAMFGAGLFDGPLPKKDPAESQRIARIAAEQSVVLLENQGDLLPLYATKIHSIGVVGSEELLNAVRQRAGATAVIQGDGADVVISAPQGQPVTVQDRTRKATLEAWGNAPAATDVIFGDVNPSGKLPVTIDPRPASEGIYVGYRYFDQHNLQPQYPFGFGLSYTAFEWTNLRIFPASPRYGQTVQVVVNVHNTGQREGADTVEVYVHQRKSSVARPPKELKAFARVELKPGEAKDVAVTLDRHSMSFYDPAVKDWATEPGVFEVLVGASAREIRLKGSFELFP